MKTKKKKRPQLQEWLEANAPGENMKFHQGFWHQGMWVRDVLRWMLFKAITPAGMQVVGEDHDKILTVDGTHTSKSVKLPVYRFDSQGVTVKLRYNFHDWCIKVWGAEDVEFPHYLAHEQLNGYFEGMEDDTDGELGKPSHRYSVGGIEKVYATLWFLLSAVRDLDKRRHFVVTGRLDGGEDVTSYVLVDGDGVDAEDLFKKRIRGGFNDGVEVFISMVVETPGPPMAIFEQDDSSYTPDPITDDDDS